MDVWVCFSFPLSPKFVTKIYKNVIPEINLIKAHVGYAWFIKFRWRNLNINDLMLNNLQISLITKRFFLFLDRHSDKTVTLNELLQDINNFSKIIVDIIRKSHEFSFKIVRVITIVVSNPVNVLVNARLWRQSIASGYSMTLRFSAILLLSPPSYILYTLHPGTARIAESSIVYLSSLNLPNCAKRSSNWVEIVIAFSWSNNYWAFWYIRRIWTMYVYWL